MQPAFQFLIGCSVFFTAAAPQKFVLFNRDNDKTMQKSLWALDYAMKKINTADLSGNTATCTLQLHCFSLLRQCHFRNKILATLPPSLPLALSRDSFSPIPGSDPELDKQKKIDGCNSG